MTLQRPGELFDRTHEWADLTRFVEATTQLGIVWGPRRAGKSTLLAALAESTGGLYYEAVRQDAALSLDELGRLIAARSGVPDVRLTRWDETLDALLTTGGPVTVLDEFGYLCDVSPELPTVVQRVIDRRRRQRGTTGRLILCGSAVGQLSHLLDRDQPLFGRAQLATPVTAFDHRSAAAYWGVDGQARLAFLLHAVVGGLPGYRDVIGAAPSSVRSFDRWITETVLSGSSPLLEEDALILQATGTDATVYRSILTAVVLGDRTPTTIARRLGRQAPSLARPLENLVQAGLLTRVVDPLRAKRSRYEVADPFIVFHDTIIRPNRTQLRRRRQSAVWAASAESWQAQILGPHLERLARETCSIDATLVGRDGPVTVGATVVNDARGRSVHELDVIAVDANDRVAAIGEVKLGDASWPDELARLDRIRELLGDRATGCRLLLFSGERFPASMQRAVAGRSDVVLVDLERLYSLP